MKENNEKRVSTYNDVFNISVILNAMPLDGIKGKALCDIIMLKVDYGKLVDGFNSRMDEALKKLKAEKYPKFDEESQKEEADRCEDYKAWLDELTKLYSDMRMDEAKKEVEGCVPDITRGIVEAFCTTGVEGEITLPGGTETSPTLMPKVTALHLLAQWVKE